MNISREIPCSCGRPHKLEITDIISESGAINKLPEVMSRLGCRHPFVLCESNTLLAAGERVTDILRRADIHGAYYIPKSLSPNERAVGDVVINAPTLLSATTIFSPHPLLSFVSRVLAI